MPTLPRPNPASKVDYANARRKRRTTQRERIGKSGEGQVATGPDRKKEQKNGMEEKRKLYLAGGSGSMHRARLSLKVK